MPIQSTTCPKCGKETSEYAENKWQCLHCGRKFVYEEPVDVQQHITVRQYILPSYGSTENIKEESSECATVFGYLLLFIMICGSLCICFEGYSQGESKWIVLALFVVLTCFILYVFSKLWYPLKVFAVIAIFILIAVQGKSIREEQIKEMREYQNKVRKTRENQIRNQKTENIVKKEQPKTKVKPDSIEEIEPIYEEKRSMIGQEWKDRPEDFGVEPEIVKPKIDSTGSKTVEVELNLTEDPIIIEYASKKARSLLGLAQSYLAANHAEKARKIFVSIVNDYPETKSAELAKKELEKLSRN